MLDVDMDCEQAFDGGPGRKWFELKAFVAPIPGWEKDITQTSHPTPPFPSINHEGLCGMINLFVANFPNLPAGLDPPSAKFLNPSYTHLCPLDARHPSSDVLLNTPCVPPDIVRRC